MVQSKFKPILFESSKLTKQTRPNHSRQSNSMLACKDFDDLIRLQALASLILWYSILPQYLKNLKLWLVTKETDILFSRSQ